MGHGKCAIINAQLATPIDMGRPLRGENLKAVKFVDQATLIIEDGVITYVGTEKPLEVSHTIDAQGSLVTPGLVDPHTHLVHGGSREKEVPYKLAGADYMEIYKAGGGINSTVNATREATAEALLKQAQHSHNQMLLHGVTMVESKSGYGLSTEQELKMLKVAHQLATKSPMDIVHTFMGAHAIPLEYTEQPQDYVKLLLEEMIPAIASSGLAEFCDVFCEEGVFGVEESRQILLTAKAHGFKLKLHADEIVSLGGAELAAELAATSADHLMAASDTGLSKMAMADVVGVLLPGTSFYLKKAYARARDMIDLGVPIALASDYNPGSCPSENMQLIMTLAYLYLGLYPEEILTACTLNAAYALDRADKVGSLEVGKQGDVVIWNADNLAYLPYHFGVNHVNMVIKKGRVVVKEGGLVYE